jgi:hypothetical protein
MYNSFKSLVFPTKKNKFKSPLLSNKSLTVYFIFLLFINLLLPYFITGGNITPLTIYNKVNKYRSNSNLKNLNYSKSLSLSANEILNDINTYQYLSPINPTTGRSFYDYINTKRFSNTNEILLTNYISSTSEINAVKNNYSDIVLTKNINSIGIAIRKINLFGNNQNITLILTGKGNTNGSSILETQTSGGFINYNIITYTDLFIIIFIIILMLTDILFTYYYNTFENRSIPHTNLVLSIITIIITLILIIGIAK